jgi:hypothetical protein
MRAAALGVALCFSVVIGGAAGRAQEVEPVSSQEVAGGRAPLQSEAQLRGWPFSPQVELYGYTWTPSWEGPSAVRANVQTADGVYWPVVCRRPNLAVCTGVLWGALPLPVYVRGSLLPGKCSGCTVEVAPVVFQSLYP